jgi:hypothetical protein
MWISMAESWFVEELLGSGFQNKIKPKTRRIWV